MRCYNGCPDTQLQTLIDETTNAMQRLKAICQNAHCTYFPIEEIFQVWLDNRPIGKESKDKLEAIEDAINNITRQPVRTY